MAPFFLQIIAKRNISRRQQRHHSRNISGKCNDDHAQQPAHAGLPPAVGADHDPGAGADSFPAMKTAFQLKGPLP
jgi:hypothetical protein